MEPIPYQTVEDAFREGEVESKDSTTLGRYLLALANQPIESDRVKHRDVIRGITINHVLLQRHIAELDKKNANTQKLVVALTIAAVITGGIQIWYASKADKRSEAESLRPAQTQQPPITQSMAPSQMKPQVCHPASAIETSRPLFVYQVNPIESRHSLQALPS